eukprot:14766811-Ditylum_brightwellii.AAC.1
MRLICSQNVWDAASYLEASQDHILVKIPCQSHIGIWPSALHHKVTPSMDVRLVTAKTGHLQRSVYAPELHVLAFLDEQFSEEAPH